MKNHYELDNQLPIMFIEWETEYVQRPLHWHDCLEIGYCLSGTGQFLFEKKSYEVSTGDVFVINNVEKHMTYAEPNDNDVNRFLFMKFDVRLLEGEREELFLPFAYRAADFPHRINSNSTISQVIGNLILELWDEYRLQPFAYQSIVRSGAIRICAYLARYYAKNLEQTQATRMIAIYRRIQPALDYIKQHYAGPITLNEVAEVLHLSYSRTYHLFKEAVGRSFKDYVNALRIRDAKELLQLTDHSVTEIYLACGFQSHTPFYRCFMREVGMTPRYYRERYGNITLLD
jgi:AraC-like DNA-binding protein